MLVAFAFWFAAQQHENNKSPLLVFVCLSVCQSACAHIGTAQVVYLACHMVVLLLWPADVLFAYVTVVIA